MKVQVSNTDKLVTVHGRELRVWQGLTERGHHVALLVAYTVKMGNDEKEDAQFQDDLANRTDVHPIIAKNVDDVLEALVKS